VGLNQNALAARVDAILRPLGFSRQNLAWNRRADGIVEVVSIQISKVGEIFTLNLGVLDPEAYTLCWGKPPSEFVDEADCTARVRLGFLLKGKDTWWGDSDEQTLTGVASALLEEGLPFLEAHRSSAAIKEYLESSGALRGRYPPPVIYWAALSSRHGEHAAACATLADLHDRTSGPWRANIEGSQARLGCSMPT
jgi:hypothetical protein